MSRNSVNSNENSRQLLIEELKEQDICSSEDAGFDKVDGKLENSLNNIDEKYEGGSEEEDEKEDEENAFRKTSNSNTKAFRQGTQRTNVM